MFHVYNESHKSCLICDQLKAMRMDVVTQEIMTKDEAKAKYPHMAKAIDEMGKPIECEWILPGSKPVEAGDEPVSDREVKE